MVGFNIERQFINFAGDIPGLGNSIVTIQNIKTRMTSKTHLQVSIEATSIFQELLIWHITNSLLIQDYVILYIPQSAFLEGTIIFQASGQ